MRWLLRWHQAWSKLLETSEWSRQVRAFANRGKGVSGSTSEGKSTVNGQRLKEIQAQQDFKPTQHLIFLNMFSMKVASVWAWLLIVIRFYFNEMPKSSSGFQPSKCSSTLWRLNGCHRPTSTGTGLCISWCWENRDIHLYIQSKMEVK